MLLTTGQEAWEVFSNTYASSDVSNIMKLEERFGAAKKTTGMSISQWFGHVQDLASKLRVVLPSERVANRMLNGLGPEGDNVKWTLKVRSGRLTVELVTQHLLAAEAERKKLRQIGEGIVQLHH